MFRTWKALVKQIGKWLKQAEIDTTRPNCSLGKHLSDLASPKLPETDLPGANLNPVQAGCRLLAGS
jgi:hypothetical protein